MHFVNKLGMRKLSLIFQEVLKFFLIFLLVFVWVRYFVRRLAFAFLISALISAVIYVALLLIFRKKKNKEGLKIKEKEDAENMFFSLVCDDERMDFFMKLALSKHKNVKKHSQYLIIEHENGVKTLLYILANFENLTVPKFMDIYNKIKNKAQKMVILCYSYDREVVSFAGNFDKYFIFLDRFSAYERLFKYYNIFPEVKQKYKKDKKLTFKDFMAYSFNKKRVKGYILSSFLLVLSALFVRTTIYYCLTATVLIIFAIISQFNTTFNLKEEEVL